MLSLLKLLKWIIGCTSKDIKVKKYGFNARRDDLSLSSKKSSRNNAMSSSDHHLINTLLRWFMEVHFLKGFCFISLISRFRNTRKLYWVIEMVQLMKG
jgi:hypothetical protein